MTELRLVGGDIALDLVNTVEPRLLGQAPERDHLTAPDALATWAHRAGVLDAPAAQDVAAAWRERPETGAAALADVLRIRDSAGGLLDAVRAGAEPTADASEHLMRRSAEALTRARLSADPDGRRPVRLRLTEDPSTSIADRLAVAVVEFARSADLGRLKACPPEEGGCGWLFIDGSRNGSRRWCSMDDCGTRTKMRRLTARRRDARAAGSSMHPPEHARSYSRTTAPADEDERVTAELRQDSTGVYVVDVECGLEEAWGGDAIGAGVRVDEHNEQTHPTSAAGTLDA